MQRELDTCYCLQPPGQQWKPTDATTGGQKPGEMQERVTGYDIIELAWYVSIFLVSSYLCAENYISPMIRYLVSCGRSVLAKSVTPHRIEQNMCLVRLEETELNAINTFIQSVADKRGFTRYVYPAFGIDFGFPDKQ